MNLIKSTGTFSFYTIISRILGYFRDVLIAVFLGTSFLWTYFLLHLEYLIHLGDCLLKEHLMRLLFQVILQKLIKKNQSNKFANEVFNILFLILLILTLVAQIFMPGLVVFLPLDLLKIQKN